MIYISSSCSKKKKITESVTELAKAGFQNIELSGGTTYSDSLIADLIELKTKYNLKFLLHNYFPPPKEPFVLNLASSNRKIRENSLSHIKKAIDISLIFNAPKYGFHAGYYLNPKVSDLGEKISVEIQNKTEGKEFFIDNYLQLEHYSDQVELYIENNVLSKPNFQNYEDNPFMLTSSKDVFDLKKSIPYKLLLDIAHLKVSCGSLGLQFEEELEILIQQTDYIHLSDNDGDIDSNQPISKKSSLFRSLKSYDLSNKTITLEVYTGLEDVIQSYELINSLQDGNKISGL